MSAQERVVMDVDLTLTPEVFAHWHAGQPRKGCVAGCGLVFTQPKTYGTHTPCAECMNRQFSDSLTVCPCYTKESE